MQFQVSSFARVATFLALISLSKAAVTLYEVVSPEQTQNPEDGEVILERSTVGFSTIGVNEDGATTYVMEVVNTLVVWENPEFTSTILSTPETVRNTWVEDASGYTWSIEATGAKPAGVEVCAFGSDGTGTCVREIVAPNTDLMMTETYSGPLSAWVTIADPTNSGGSLPEETGVPDNSAIVGGLANRGQIVGFTLAVLGCAWLGL
ncbi:hypothetical protein AX16_001223 [Volvariella volvacea WC 439]|nr:hypothetical protein AX16_001223 [Volvariella volvacea WC 439]